MADFWGYHLMVDVSGCNREKITSQENIKNFAKQLVNDIEMKAFGEPIIVYLGGFHPDKAGYSLVQLIETSNICAHFIDRDNAIYIDIFSCKYFETEVAVNVIKQFFEPVNIKINYLTRQA